MLSSEKRLKETFSNYTDEKTIWRLHILDPQISCDAITRFSSEDSNDIWSYAEGAKSRYPDNTIVVEQIQRQWVVFDSDPTQSAKGELTQNELFNNYRITQFKHDGNLTYYLTSLNACIIYILDHALLHDYYKLEVYNSDNNEWNEWKSLKGRTINEMRNNSW